MPLTTHTVSLTTTKPDGVTPLDGVWTLKILSAKGTLKNLENGSVAAGKRNQETVAGYTQFVLPAIPQANVAPSDAAYQLHFNPTGRQAGSLTTEPFQLTADRTLADLHTESGLPITPSVLSETLAAAERAETAATAAEAVGTTNDTVIASRVNDPASATRAALSTTFAPKDKPRNQAPGALVNVTTAAETTATPRAIDHFGGYWWGITTDGRIHRSTDGDAWTEVAAPGFVALRLFPTADGEVIAATGNTVRKSTGWAANPATATWATVLTLDGTDSFLGCGIDTDEDGQRFIATGYNGVAPPRTTSNKVWISTDAGATWTVVYDNATRNPGTYTDSHVHSVAHDRWANRWWISEGHGTAARGLYWSDDNGGTWTRIARDNMDPDGAPFAMVATDAGLVLGSDSIEGAVFVVRRTVDPTAMRVQILARRGKSTNASGQVLYGSRDATTGIVYLIGDNLADDTHPVTIWASDGTTATRVHAIAAGATMGVQSIVAHGGKVRAAYWPTANSASVTQLKGTATASWGRDLVSNEGNIGGGRASHPTTVAVGPGVDTDATMSVFIGMNQTSTGTSGVVLIGTGTKGGTVATAVGTDADAKDTGAAFGRGALCTGNEAVAMGDTAKAGLSSVAVGRNSTAAPGAFLSAVAIGYGANAGRTQSIAIGASAACTVDSAGIAIGQSAAASNWSVVAIGSAANASGHGAVGIGQGAVSSATRSVALGRLASATHDNSVALASASTTAANQLMVGDRDIVATRTGGGLTLRSPDGTAYKLTIANGGTVSVVAG